MCAHARNDLVGAGVGQLELDIAVELLKALIAAELRSAGGPVSRASRRSRSGWDEVMASLLVFVDAEAACGERGSELVSAVVQGLV